MLLLVLDMCIHTKNYTKTKRQKVKGFHCKIAQFRRRKFFKVNLFPEKSLVVLRINYHHNNPLSSSSSYLAKYSDVTEAQGLQKK